MMLYILKNAMIMFQKWEIDPNILKNTFIRVNDSYDCTAVQDM